MFSSVGILSEFQKSAIFFAEAVCLSLSLFVTVLMNRLGFIPALDTGSNRLAGFLFYFIALMIVCWARILDESLFCCRHGQLGKLVFAQFFDLAITIGLFYCIPLFGALRGDTFFVYALSYLLLTSAWRASAPYMLGCLKKRRAVLIAPGENSRALFADTNRDPGFPLEFSAFILEDPLMEPEPTNPSLVLRHAVADGVDLIVMDTTQRSLVAFYGRLFPGISFADYGAVFKAFYGLNPKDKGSIANARE